MCSRSQAALWIAEGRVTVDGRVIHDPEFAIHGTLQRIVVSGLDSDGSERLYMMLNKPRGLVTTASDEQGRDTVYRCFDGAGIPWIAPVGRLDKASEGLLLFTNDGDFALRIQHPRYRVPKTYRVKVDGRLSNGELRMLCDGIPMEDGLFRAVSAVMERKSRKSCWVQVTVTEGRNRVIRRAFDALDHSVVRLIRVAVSDLSLGDLKPGSYRHLTNREVSGLIRRPK